VENDLGQFAKIESLQLEKITAPTLVVVGSADIDVPTEHSEYAASVYTFGDAPYFGAPGHGTATSAVATPDGKGYWNPP
jgi:pimeloyl-ACP methyl ester carboxylesterase